MSLAEKVENLYVRLIGNKVTAAATLSILGSTYSSLDGENGFFLSTLLGTINGVAILSLLATKCSAGTLHFYHRTEQHIEKYGLLKPRVVELWMATRTENMPELGYCQQQGIYLAARKHGQLNAFYEAKEKASKVKIPHF
ncbi:MAG: hypothetical protein AABX24_05025 [Nanoarchaeota archaeon]